MTKEAMQQALEALRMPCEFWNKTQFIKVTEAIKALEEALNQEQGEPVAMRYDFDGYGYKYIDSGSGSDWQTRERGAEPLYTTPQKRKPLTDEEIRKFQHHVVSGAYQHSFIQGVRYAESAHKIKE